MLGARMNYVITGGGGFLGNQLARSIEARDDAERIILVDCHFDEGRRTGFGEQVSFEEGSISDPAVVERCMRCVGEGEIAVFHLASMVSGECETRFEEALEVNLDGTRLWLDALKKAPGKPKFVFTSSVAAFGGAAMPDRVGDCTKRSPQTTYGVTKVIIELLINDYSRKGFIDGRGARLPTVIIRPGRPNTAASSFASGIFRERLNGEVSKLPVKRSQVMPVIGYRTVIDSLIALSEMEEGRFDGDRIFTLPSLALTVEEMTDALEEVATELGLKLGPLEDRPDPVIQKIVDGWPTDTTGERAIEAGLPDAGSLEDIIRCYLADFG